MFRVEAKIEAIVRLLSRKHKYIYEGWSGANEVIDQLEESDFPVCLNVLPISGTLFFGNVQSFDAPSCLIAFLDRASELDFKGDPNELSVNKCKDAAREFINLCNASGWFEPIDSVYYSVVYDKLDATLTGVMLDIRLQERTGAPICPISKSKFPSLRTFDDTFGKDFD